MRNKNKRRCGIIASALVLLALSASPAAYGQKDGFFNNADGVRSGGDAGTSWNGMAGGGADAGTSWNGMEDATPLGGGLLVLALSGVCYAAARVKRGETHGRASEELKD